jgi:hypothetical protein
VLGLAPGLDEVDVDIVLASERLDAGIAGA